MALDKLTASAPAGKSGEDYGWLSEETEDDLIRLEKSHVWIVDPIDGTRAFLHDKPHWVVSVALVVDGVVRMGCLYNPVKQQFFEAVLGEGAKLNGQKMQIAAQSDIEGATIISAPGRFKSKIWPTPGPALRALWSIRLLTAWRWLPPTRRMPIDPFWQKRLGSGGG